MDHPEAPSTTETWPPALVELYQMRAGHLRRLAYLMTGEQQAAEELVQDAFIRSRARWDEVRAPDAYLRTAVANGARSWLRSRGRERRLQPDAPEPEAMHPDELWDALGRLQPRQRIAIVLRFYEGLHDIEIAEALGCRRATVRSLIHRGIAELRKEIEQ